VNMGCVSSSVSTLCSVKADCVGRCFTAMSHPPHESSLTSLLCFAVRIWKTSRFTSQLTKPKSKEVRREVEGLASRAHRRPFRTIIALFGIIRQWCGPNERVDECRIRTLIFVSEGNELSQDCLLCMLRSDHSQIYRRLEHSAGRIASPQLFHFIVMMERR
jgi:hypothetical protein